MRLYMHAYLVLIDQILFWQKPRGRKRRVQQDSSDEDEVPLKPTSMSVENAGDMEEDDDTDEDYKPRKTKVVFFEKMFVLFPWLVCVVCICMTRYTSSTVFDHTHICTQTQNNSNKEGNMYVCALINEIVHARVHVQVLSAHWSHSICTEAKQEKKSAETLFRWRWCSTEAQIAVRKWWCWEQRRGQWCRWGRWQTT